MKIKKGRSIVVTFKGGPWNGKKAKASSSFPSTGSLHFKLDGWHGHYDGSGQWVDA